MKLAVAVAAVLSLLSVSSLHGSCQLNLRQEDGEIRWDAVQGAELFTVVESYGDDSVRVFQTMESSFKIARRSTTAIVVNYVVTATLAFGTRAAEVETNDACTATLQIDLPIDEAFRKFTRRAVFPVVGSTPGSFGGRFKTALTLRSTGGSQRGRIVFHPAGRVAGDQDPSLPYSFTTSPQMTFDDVVAAMGQSGIGSMEIIPDDDGSAILPQMEVRLYNDTSIGTFGTFAFPAYPYDYLRVGVMEIDIPDGRFRVNVGFRTLTETSMRILIYNTEHILVHFFTVSFPAGWMQMTSASDFAGRNLLPGQSLQVFFTGSVIPFHTITENATNDPTLIVSPALGKSRNVGEYID